MQTSPADISVFEFDFSRPIKFVFGLSVNKLNINFTYYNLSSCHGLRNFNYSNCLYKANKTSLGNTGLQD